LTIVVIFAKRNTRENAYRKKTQYIKELQEEIAELKEQIESLKEQVEKMKLCQNCKFEDNDFMEEPCRNCIRCLGEDIKREGTSEKWEIKENE
jgi:peptidoglycan hydrolase CwlO-like protein